MILPRNQSAPYLLDAFGLLCFVNRCRNSVYPFCGVVKIVMATTEEAAATPTVETTEEPKKVTKEKKPRAPKERKPKQPKTASHPPYFQMIKEALLALNDKSGSSPYAIAKYMEEKHKAVLPANFKKILALQLKNSAAKGKLIKIKASYKLSESGKKDSKKTTTAAKPKPKITTTTTQKRTRSSTLKATKPEATKKQQPAKKAKKSTPAKPKQPKSIKSPAAKKAKKAAATA